MLQCIMLQCICTHCKMATTLRPVSICSHAQLQSFSLAMRTFQTYSQQLSSESTVLFTPVTMLYITSPRHLFYRPEVCAFSPPSPICPTALQPTPLATTDLSLFLCTCLFWFWFVFLNLDSTYK